MTAKQPRETGKKAEKPSFLERAFVGLEEHFAHGEHGQETGHERPDVEEESTQDEQTINADRFQDLTRQAEKDQEEECEHRRERVAEEREERVKELSKRHVGDEQWSDLIRCAREAAKAGKSEFQLLRFPSQLCSDGGRAINVNEEGWPKSLRGEAQEIYRHWEKELKPKGFHLTAKILDFPEGFPGDAGLFLTWDK